MNAREALQLLEYQVQDKYDLAPELAEAIAVLATALEQQEGLWKACEALLENAETSMTWTRKISASDTDYEALRQHRKAMEYSIAEARDAITQTKGEI